MLIYDALIRYLLWEIIVLIVVPLNVVLIVVNINHCLNFIKIQPVQAIGPLSVENVLVFDRKNIEITD